MSPAILKDGMKRGIMKIIYKVGKMLEFNECCPICGSKIKPQEIWSEDKNKLSVVISNSNYAHPFYLPQRTEPAKNEKSGIRYLKYECSGPTENDPNSWDYNLFKRKHFTLKINPKINEIIMVKYIINSDKDSVYKIEYTNWYNEQNKQREVKTRVDLNYDNIFVVGKKEFENILDMPNILNKIELLINFR